MANEISPPGWFLRPSPWARWMPDVMLNRTPVFLPLAHTSFGPSIDAWDQRASYWNNGDSDGVETPLGGVLGLPKRQESPSGLESALSSGGTGGILGRLGQSTEQPTDNPWLFNTGAATWAPPTLPVASALPIPPAPPFKFPASPPVEHLHSARYWGAAQTPSGPEPPAHGFYLSPVPQAPRWDQLPTDPVNRATQIFQEPPSPALWDAPASDLQDTAASNLAYSPPAPARQTDPQRLQLAGIAPPFPGIRPLPPLPLPGTPEWTDHFIRGLQGLIHAFRSKGRGGRRRSDDDDYCHDRKQAEISRCFERKDDYAHGDFLQACQDRATERWIKCLRNKGRPDPNEPNEWGPEDEEIWRNFGR